MRKISRGDADGTHRTSNFHPGIHGWKWNGKRAEAFVILVHAKYEAELLFAIFLE